MAFESNIDTRGKAVRMKLGVCLVISGFILAALVFFDIVPTPLGWVLVGGILAGGAFTIWESRRGWCVIRAMGFKTRI